jgi:hypothetical protein
MAIGMFRIGGVSDILTAKKAIMAATRSMEE